MLTELDRGVYYESDYAGGNTGLVVSDRGSLLVDVPMLPRDARQWQLTLMQMGGPALYGIANTDYHPAHFLGNAFFLPTRTFGHQLSAKPISKYATSTLEQVSIQYRDTDPAMADEILQVVVQNPEICVEDRLTLHLGDRRVQLLQLDGHTPASLGVYLPEERILFAGDNIIAGEHPTMYHANSLAWLRTLEYVKQMDVETIVPGSGEVCGKQVIDPLYDYIVEMRRRVTELFEKGASRRECVDKVGMLDWFPFPADQAGRVKRRRRGSVERVYTEVRIASRGKR